MTKICEVHGAALTEMAVPIHYGLPAPNKTDDVRARLFPNAHFHVNGGCMFNEEAECTVAVCEECREAEKAWRAINDPPRDALVDIFSLGD